MKRSRLFSTLVFGILIVFAFSMGIAESARDYRAEFSAMEQEELESILEILSDVLNEKKIGNATIQVVLPDERIAVDKPVRISVTAEGREMTAKTKVSFTSSDETVATVTNGQLKGLKEGNATITATAVFEDGATLESSAQVSVYVPVKSIKGSPKTTAFAGGSLDLKELVSVLPEDATEKGLIFEVSDPEIATVDENGILSGVKGGSVTVTVTSAEKTEKPASAKLTVDITQAVSSISLDTTSLTVGKNKTAQITATVGPESATDNKVVWTSDNPAVATVSAAGLVKGVGTGTTTIHCTAKDGSGVTAEAGVTVITAVNSVKIAEKDTGIILGDSVKLTCNVMPADATDSRVRWTSSDTSIAEVDAYGNVTGKSTGKVTITAAAMDGSGAKSSINVYIEPKNPVDITYIHWQTIWGVKNGRMGVGATNMCSFLSIKSFNYTIECSSWLGGSAMDTDTYRGSAIAPGKYKKGKLSKNSVSGFSSANNVSITVTDVTFTNGYTYHIPVSDQESSTFSP